MKRFESYGWHCIHVTDGDNDLAAIDAAIAEAKTVKDKPTIIKLTTTIGYGSKLQGTHEVHGSPLKADDIKSIKAKFGFDPEKKFDVPSAVYENYGQTAAKGAAAEEEWNQLFAKYQKEYPEEGKDLARRLAGKLPEGWEKALPTYMPRSCESSSLCDSNFTLDTNLLTLPLLLVNSLRLSFRNSTLSFLSWSVVPQI